MTYELVISDLGGVVVEFNADRLVHQVSQLLGRSFDEVQGIVYDKELLLPFELGRIDAQTYYAGLQAKLQLSWTYDRFVQAWNDIFTENADVTEIMSRLRARHRLVALSNTNALHLAYIRASIPSLSFFEEWIASCDVGLRKPDPQIYRLVLERCGVDARHAVYIDDRPDMVEGGRQAGLTAIRFEHSRQLEQDLRSIGLAL